MTRRKGLIDDLLDSLLELSSMVWQVGVVISFFLALGSFKALWWAVDKHSVAIHSKVPLETIFKHMPWIYYVFPLALGVVTILFVVVTFRAYSKSNNHY